MLRKTLILAAGASLLSFSAALAADPAASPQMSAEAPTTVNPLPSGATPPLDQHKATDTSSAAHDSAPSANASASSAADAGANVAATEAAGGLLVGTETIASAPVPDTRENRRMYGAPLSMTGKRTAPAGN